MEQNFKRAPNFNCIPTIILSDSKSQKNTFYILFEILKVDRKKIFQNINCLINPDTGDSRLLSSVIIPKDPVKMPAFVNLLNLQNNIAKETNVWPSMQLIREIWVGTGF